MRELAFNPFIGTFDWVDSPDEVFQSVSFGYASGTMVLQAVAAGSLLTGVAVQVETAFDGGAALVLGTATSPSLVFAAGEVALDTPNQYSNPEVVPFPSADFLTLTITQTGATQGTGKLWFRYRSQP